MYVTYLNNSQHIQKAYIFAGAQWPCAGLTWHCTCETLMIIARINNKSDNNCMTRNSYASCAANHALTCCNTNTKTCKTQWSMSDTMQCNRWDYCKIWKDLRVAQVHWARSLDHHNIFKIYYYDITSHHMKTYNMTVKWPEITWAKSSER